MTAIDRLKERLPQLSISIDEGDFENYGQDWTRLHPPAPLAIAFPKDTQEVQGIILWANDENVGLVPSGGRTGLSGGAVAANGELVLSLEKMNRILAYHEKDSTLQVQAGVVTQVAQEQALEAGRYFPVGFASEGSSQIGGNIATNAGGIQVLRYGMFRDWVAGLKVVTGKGDILDLNKSLIKNATGYDLRHLFIGSEGTLGVVVEATLRLTRPPEERQVMLLAVPDMPSAVEAMQRFRSAVDLLAFEFFSDNAVDYVMAHTQVPPPLSQRYPYYVLLEFEAQGGPNTEKAFDTYQQLMQDGLALDDAFGDTAQTRTQLWGYRENISVSISSHLPYKNDISVRISEVAPFLQEIEALVQREYPSFTVLWYGHIADGNLHLNILKPKELSLADFRAQCEQVNTAVFSIVQKYGGSISAEHGLGLLKKPYLHYSRPETEVAYLRAIKQAFDPKGIMNPGKML